LGGALYCVQMGEKLGHLWFLHDHNSFVCISFPQTWRICNGFQSAFFDVFHDYVCIYWRNGRTHSCSKNLFLVFPWKVKFVECKQISSTLIRSVVDKFVRWLSSGSDWRRYLAIFNANWIGTFVNKDTTSNETNVSSVWSNSWAIDDAKSEKFLTWCFDFPISGFSSG